MKVIGIIGSRERNTVADYQAVEAAFHGIYMNGDEIVSGGCPKGGDHFAEAIAKIHQIPIKIYYAQWNRLGKSAGFQRNSDIARTADVLIACVNPDRQGGTEDTIKKFQACHARLEMGNESHHPVILV